MLNGPDLAEEQLREIAEVSAGTVQVDGTPGRFGGCLVLDISIRFDGLERVEGGLPVRAREQFRIFVPPRFPYERPCVETTHRRFAGFPHVQWSRHPCLYRSSADWMPEDGMYGFIARLDSWVRDAARDDLDPDDAPLHPPVAYATANRLVVPRADTPCVRETPWTGVAELRQRSHRTEIIGWRTSSEPYPAHFAPAVLLPGPLPFEYPETVKALLTALESHNIDFAPLVLLLASLAYRTASGTPLTVVLGTPMRRTEEGGPALQHLAVWEIAAEDADKLREMEIAFQDDDTNARTEAIRQVVRWSLEASVNWCVVREMRPEVTRRRDGGTPTSWFRGKRVAIWGCGAIGTHVAEHIVRGGATYVELVDKGQVVPGILVRQTFEDQDIGLSKAEALASRLKRIEPEIVVEAIDDNLIHRVDDAIPEVDLVIDCTASSTFRVKLERTLRGLSPRPPIASLAVAHDASSGIAALSTEDHSGGPLDLIRRLKLEVCRRPTLSKLRDTFWPVASRPEHFQPEPGCSEPTFVGSNADLAYLSARMLNGIAAAVATPAPGQPGAAWVLDELGVRHRFSFTPDHTLEEAGRGYSIRVSPGAAREMRAWTRRSARMRGRAVETGGLVFGELSEAAGVLWVTEVEGPPPDSEAAEDHFTCGTVGMRAAADEKQRRYHGSVACIGSWHTHPTTGAHPSLVDIRAVAHVLAAPHSTRRTFVLLILSGDADEPVLGAHAFRRTLPPGESIRLEGTATTRLGREPYRPREIGLALSGGGSRAIAFHLGCLRALSDLRLLTRLQVVSSVSGGSVISAMYAYSDTPFRDFDARVVELLRQGLTTSVARALLRPRALAKALYSLGANSVVSLLRGASRLLPALLVPKALLRAAPPIRAYSRTEAFRDALQLVFGDKLMRDVGRKALDVVVNATELRTASAFRFGSRQSGCWRFGEIDATDATVADAVAASAAYPTLLPALDRTYSFTKDGRPAVPTRVLLSDGGVFENLGVGPMEPGRDSRISTNVFDPAYVIACDAGTGLYDDDEYPMWWASRMSRAFATTFRKVQDATRGRLHSFSDAGSLSGFALPYLGQDDDRLPWIPPELPRRREVSAYPTDFAPMRNDDIDVLTRRGELLTRFLLAYYLPEL